MGNMKSNTVINSIDEILQETIFAFIKEYKRPPDYIYLGDFEYTQLKKWWFTLIGNEITEESINKFSLDTYNGYDIILVKQPTHLGLGI